MCTSHFIHTLGAVSYLSRRGDLRTWISNISIKIRIKRAYWHKSRLNDFPRQNERNLTNCRAPCTRLHLSKLSCWPSRAALQGWAPLGLRSPTASKTVWPGLASPASASCCCFPWMNTIPLTGPGSRLVMDVPAHWPDHRPGLSSKLITYLYSLPRYHLMKLLRLNEI